MTDCTVSGNTASGQGGGIYTDGTTTITGCTISNNSNGTIGGGLSNNGETTLTNCTVSGDSASVGGGGLANYSDLTVNGCGVNGNSGDVGAGLLNDEDGDITVSDSTLSGNSASESGGGAYNVSGTLALSIAPSPATRPAVAGAAWLTERLPGPLCWRLKRTRMLAARAQDESQTMSLLNCTVSGNTAYDGTGGVDNNAMLSVTNTIVAGNIGGNVTGSFTGSNNLVGGNPLLSVLGR